MSSPPIPSSDCAPRGQLVSINTAAKITDFSTKTIRRDGSLRAYPSRAPAPCGWTPPT